MTKIDNHLKKMEHLEKSREKLDSYEKDYELIIESYMLICAPYVNAALHKLGKLDESRDIKHNLIANFLVDQFEDAGKVRAAMQKLEDLRPSHGYGKGENGETAKKAEEYYNEVRKICRKILGFGD